MDKYASATEDLAKLFCRANVKLSNPWHFGMSHTFSEHKDMIPFSQIPGFLDQVRRLLTAGADIGVCINTFQFEGRKYHQVYGGTSDPNAEFFEGHVSCFRSKAHMEQSYCVMRTPIIDAIYAMDMTTIQLLIQRGAKIPSFNHWLRNPYMPAVATNNYVLLDILLEAIPGAADIPIYWWTECMEKALEIAARPNSNFNVVLALMRKGHQNPLSFLPEYISEVIIDHAIQHNIALLELRKDQPEILGAAFLDHLDLCRLVVQNGADIKACEQGRFSALHVAVGNKTIDVCKYLIHSGADVLARDLHSMTPLLEAVYYGHTDAIRFLLAMGVSPIAVCMEFGRTSTGNEGEKCLRLHGPWREIRDVAVEWFQMQQWSAVHIAAYRGLTSIVELLVDYGADITVKDNLGCTALDVAIKNSNSATAFWLLAHDCPFDPNTEAASRLVGQAMEDCNNAMVQQLLKLGVCLPTGDEPPEGYSGDLTGNTGVVSKARDGWINAMFSEMSIATTRTMPLICTNCSLALKIARIDLSSANQEPKCHLCRLVQDCASIAYTNTMDIKYINDKGAPDRELLMKTSDNRFLHPMRMISYEWHDFLQKLDNLDDTNTGSPAAMTMARHWLQRCTKSHFQCNRRLTSIYSPTRVLDLAGIDNGQDPKLLQNVKLDSGFAALSHRWGLEGLPSTTSHNLDDRLVRLPLAELSRTMRDAIEIVRKLNLRYLWIDALCIIQDSTEDWLQEASRMSDVFSGAIVTIAVADADHHAQGIFRARRTRCVRPFPIPYLQSMPHRERTQINGEGEFYAFPKHGLLGSGNRTKGTLDSRAWILQEQLLSPRILYFGDGEIFWDCVTLSASESSPISASLLYDSDPDETWALKLLRRTLAKSTETTTLRKRIADVWTQIIKNYSARKLTRSTDKLIALEGIVKPLAAILRVEPVAGMWRDQLWRQLIWWVADPAPGSEATFFAPTWSWLSALGPVYYHNSTRTEDPMQEPGAHKFTDLELLAKIISMDTETYPGATGIQGTVTIAGPSFSYQLTSNDFKKKVFKSWNAAKLNLNLGRWLLDDTLDLPRTIQCVIIAEDSVAKMLVILCLVPVEYLDGYWRRIGLCHWDGLAWQVSKFAGSEPDTRTFILV